MFVFLSSKQELKRRNVFKLINFNQYIVAFWKGANVQTKKVFKFYKHL